MTNLHSTTGVDRIPRGAFGFGVFSISEFSATFSVALPLAVGFVGERLIGTTDSIMLGRIGPEALSASGLALSIYNLIMISGLGMIFPMLVLAAQARGGNRFRTVPLIIRQGLWVCGILVAPGSAILWCVTPILILTGQEPHIARMAGDYMDFYLWTLFPALSTFGFSLAFTAMGRAGIVALIVCMEVAINAVLDYALVLGRFGFPAMGMEGAGLASIAAYGVGHMIFFILLAFHRFFRSTAKYLHAWWPRWHILKRFFHLGAPKAIEVLMRTGLYSGFSLLSGWIGVQALVMYTIVFEAVMAIVAMTVAVASTGAARTGMAYAGGDHAAIHRALNASILTLFVLLAPMMALFLFFPEWIVMLFLGFGSSEARALTSLVSPVLISAAFFLLAEGMRVVISQALNSLSDMKTPSLIAVLMY
uniref:Multidrug resistance protein, MATE family n=1 Tax=Candidatus Kentrum sp. TC TaxID=2126339 RepID=A0A450YKF4_9GAMM|nr:MAG: multidrug resistance protein, MATE family [Candidatus Kentron sp. TC]